MLKGDLAALGAIALLSTSQLLQKLAAQRRLANARTPRQWLAALLSPELVGAIACLAAGTALWLYTLYQMDVGRAFPFLSLSTVLVLAFSALLLGERVPPRRWAGVALICVGIALVAGT